MELLSASLAWERGKIYARPRGKKKGVYPAVKEGGRTTKRFASVGNSEL